MKRLRSTGCFRSSFSARRSCAGTSSASVATGDVEADLYLISCSTSRNPLKRFMIGPFGKFVLSRNPTLAIVIMSGVAWGLSDYLGQSWEIEAQIGWAKEAAQERSRKQAILRARGEPIPTPQSEEAKVVVDIVNPVQIVSAAIFGAFVMGLGGRFWYPFLDAAVKSRFPQASMYNRTVGKLSAEFCLWYPFTLISYWALMGAVVYNQPLSEIIQEGVGEQLVPTIASEAPLWIPAQFINFRFVPAQLQVFFVCFIAFAENVFMGYLRAEAIGDEEFQQNYRSQGH